MCVPCRNLWTPAAGVLAGYAGPDGAEAEETDGRTGGQTRGDRRQDAVRLGDDQFRSLCPSLRVSQTHSRRKQVTTVL